MVEQNTGVMLGRPLYKTTSKAVLDKPGTANAGLWYDKFCHSWHDPACITGGSPTWYRAECKKAQWIDTVAKQSAVGDAALIGQYAFRRKDLVERLGGECLSYQTESRFVTGLGREHPVENGFTWHPILGTPYLPGSSVKGLLRAWAAVERQSEIADEILGSRELANGQEGRVGAVILFDAIPIDPVKLEADVMTPHFSEYYARGEAPGDWLSPSPILFMVVAARTRFQFGIAPRATGGREQLKVIAEWLPQALQWLGAGAKTAVGYGRFEPTKQGPPSNATNAPRAQTAARSNRSGAPAAVRVRLVAPHDKLKGAFWVEEEGKKRGLLKYGEVPKELPALGSSIEVYRTSDNPRSPEYRWDAPPPPKPSNRGSRGGPRR